MTSLALSLCTPVQRMYSSLQNGCSQWQGQMVLHYAYGQHACCQLWACLHKISLPCYHLVVAMVAWLQGGLGVCTFITCQEVISDYLYIYIYIYLSIYIIYMHEGSRVEHKLFGEFPLFQLEWYFSGEGTVRVCQPSPMVLIFQRFLNRTDCGRREIELCVFIFVHTKREEHTRTHTHTTEATVCVK